MWVQDLVEAFPDGLRETMDLRDVRVVEGRQRVRLVVEAREAFGVECEVGGQDLQRSMPVG